jgi:hypothetical protein
VEFIPLTIRAARGAWAAKSKNPFLALLPWGLQKLAAWRACRLLATSLGMLLIICASLQAESLDDLQGRDDLTPASFARIFADFRYELRADVQDPHHFLTRRRGDCDDFARMASLVLGERGYHTRVVVVMMGRETHVVCHVAEAEGYLDFNHRDRPDPVTASDGTLEDIADKVAAEFRTEWRMASEIRFDKATPVFLESVFYYPRAKSAAIPVLLDDETPPSNEQPPERITTSANDSG